MCLSLQKLRVHLVSFTFGVIVGGLCFGILVGFLVSFVSEHKALRELEAKELRAIGRVITTMKLENVKIDTVSASGFKTLVTVEGASEDQVKEFNRKLIQELGVEYLYRVAVYPDHSTP